MAQSKIKLTYFNAKGRAEISRLILTAAEKPFEDVRIESSQWPSLKAQTKFNCLPTLTWGGKNYGQSMAIAAFLAREFGLYGKGNVEAMRVDEAINVCLDFQKSMMQLFYAKDDEKKAEVMKTVGEDLVKYFTMLENLLKENGSNGFFVGSKLTWADLFVFDHLERADKFKEDWGTSFPELKKLKSKVESIPAIKKYLSTRPVTSF